MDYSRSGRRISTLLAGVLTTFLVQFCSAAPDAPTAKRAPAPYIGLAPGQVAVFDVIGEHGMEHEAERRVLTGKFMAVGYAEDGRHCVVTIYHPNKLDQVLIGCPVSFLTIGPDLVAQRDPALNTAFAATYLLHILFPTKLVPTEERPLDQFQEVFTIDATMPANLTVQTIPDRADAGWVRTESLARPSDRKMLPPGSSRLVTWEAKYDVDPHGMLSLGENRYRLEVADQGNSVIAVNARLDRTSLRQLAAPEAARLNSDVAALKSVARDWTPDRARSMQTLDRLISNAKDSALASELPFIKQQLQADIKRIGERDDWRNPPTRSPATQPAGTPGR